MSTVANVHKSESSHYYWPSGLPAYELQKKSGKGMKKPNITDAKELGLLPSVTTILKLLNKPALNQWLTEQAVNAVLTTPRLEGEALDAFVHRVLHEESVQDEEARMAADKGTAIHDAIEKCVNGKEFDVAWKPYVEGALKEIANLGKIVWCEKILIGDGYGCRADILLETERHLALLDWKTTKKLPKESYLEHKLQTAACAKCIGNVADKHIITGNIYISTVIPGATFLSLQEEWTDTYERGFKPLLQYWQFANNYRPEVSHGN